MNKTTTTKRVIVTVNIIHDELRDDQIEEIALNAVYVKPTVGIIGDSCFRIQEKNKEIDYNDSDTN